MNAGIRLINLGWARIAQVIEKRVLNRPPDGEISKFFRSGSNIDIRMAKTPHQKNLEFHEFNSLKRRRRTMSAHVKLKTGLSAAFLILSAGVGFAQESASQSKADGEFYRGYYLQHRIRNYAEAVRAYKDCIKLGPGSELQAAVDAEMAELQEELATADFAQIMPSDAIVYMELSNPADHLEKIADLMGLTGKQRDSRREKASLQIENEFVIPSDFQLSPALLREIKKIRGAAVAITNVRNDGPPMEGILAIHAGESDLINGLLETGVQLAPATETIGGFPAFKIDGQIWIVKTNRLLIVASQQDQIENVLRRIADQDVDSLAHLEKFKIAREKNRGAAVFAFVNPQVALKRLDHIVDREFAMARMAIDFDHMEHVTAALMATDDGVRARLNVKFAEDHNSFGYGLIRTVPLSHKALRHVPSGSVAVVGMGLNPQMLLAAQAVGTRQLSALDIGRELFANIEEVGLFVLPSLARENDEIPDVGLVIASSDIQKSTQLWNQLLTLPSLMNIEEGPTADAISVNGVEARQYTFAEKGVPQLVVAKLGDDAMVAGTRGAVEAAINSGKSNATLANDHRLAALVDSNSEYTSKAAFLHAGRALKLAAAMEKGRDSQEMNMISELVRDLVVTLTFNEAPADFEIQTDVTGLPRFDEIIKTLAVFQPEDRRREREPTVNVQESPSDYARNQKRSRDVELDQR